MADKLTPEMFRMPLVDEAYRMRALVHLDGDWIRTDSSTAMWIIRDEAWREFRASQDFIQMQDMSSRRRELLGLPVRLTYDDSPDTPMIQLVMEHKVAPRARRG